MAVTDFLESEVIEKSRLVLFSSLLKQFADPSQIALSTREFIASHPDAVAVHVAVSTESANARTISVVPLEAAGDSAFTYFSLKPKASIESNSAVWKRECEQTKAEIVACRPALWKPHHANVSSDCPEREIALVTLPPVNAVRSAPTSAPASMTASKQTSVSGGNKLGFAKASTQQVAPPPPAKAEVLPAAIKRPAAAKFQVPLDRLDDPDTDMLPEKESSVAEDEARDAAPEIAVTIASSVAGADSHTSPEPKRARIEASESGSIDSGVSVGGPVEYRDVVVRKKTIVTEYEMGANGEMIVRDVEKMVEETRREPVRPRMPQRDIPAAAGNGTKKAEPKAKPGQGTLAGFFKPKN